MERDSAAVLFTLKRSTKQARYGAAELSSRLERDIIEKVVELALKYDLFPIGG